MTGPVPILLYHGVDHDPAPDLAPFVMAPARFAEHMDVLAERGATTFTVSDYVDLVAAGGTPPPGTVLVTFDDGLADFAAHAWPVLRARSLAATLYVVSGRVGADAAWLAALGASPAMLTAEQLVALDREGCEIGAHSVTHPELDVLEPDELVHEVVESRAELGLLLGHPIRSFAYPHGYHGKRVKEVVRKAGYHSAAAVRNLLSPIDDDRYALSRVTIDASCDADGLRAILDGRSVGVASRREQAKTKGWRAYRRARRMVGSAS